MNNLTRDCMEAMHEEMEQGYLTDVDSRLKYALRYLASDVDVEYLYKLIKTGKAPGAGKQSGT